MFVPPPEGVPEFEGTEVVTLAALVAWAQRTGQEVITVGSRQFSVDDQTSAEVITLMIEADKARDRPLLPIIINALTDKAIYGV